MLTSPLARAADTARLAGFDAEPRDELREWDYGAYEGRKTAEIREERPGWTLWADGVPNGETAAEVAARVDAVLADLRTVEGEALVFAHGHLLRVLAVRWIGLEPEAGRLLALDPATVGVLGYERETPVICVWNAPLQTPSPQTRGPAGLDSTTLSHSLGSVKRVLTAKIRDDRHHPPADLRGVPRDRARDTARALLRPRLRPRDHAVPA